MKAKDTISWIGFLLISVFVLFPLFWGIRTSFSPRYETSLIPSRLTLEHYQSLFVRPAFLLYFKNSLTVTLGAVALTLPLALLGAYALARFNFPGKQFGILLLVFPLLPLIAILVPLVSYMYKLGVYDSFMALILVNSVFNIPFALWMLRNFILNTPVEIEEAALLDGCSKIGALCRIALPLMLPGMIAVIVFVFITTWNNYLYAAALTSSMSVRVLPQALLSFIGTWGMYWEGLCAAGILTLIPPLVLFLFFQKWFIAGLFAQWSR
ncbi:Inner membrane ABC transporter permease protein YcjP [subsurface metagenome]